MPAPSVSQAPLRVEGTALRDILVAQGVVGGAQSLNVPSQKPIDTQTGRADHLAVVAYIQPNQDAQLLKESPEKTTDRVAHKTPSSLKARGKATRPISKGKANVHTKHTKKGPRRKVDTSLQPLPTTAADADTTDLRPSRHARLRQLRNHTTGASLQSLDPQPVLIALSPQASDLVEQVMNGDQLPHVARQELHKIYDARAHLEELGLIQTNKRYRPGLKIEQALSDPPQPTTAVATLEPDDYERVTRTALKRDQKLPIQFPTHDRI